MPISAEQKERLTVRIVDAAERQISEDGLAALSTRAIGREAGCSAGSIYTRFRDLDALILAVNSRTLSRFDKLLEGVEEATRHLSIEERFQQMAFAYLDLAVNHPNAWNALFDHRMPDDMPLPEWHMEDHYRLFRRIGGPLKELDPALTDAGAMTLAKTIYSAVHGIVSIGVHSRMGATPLDQIRNQLTVVLTALIDGLRRHPASGKMS